MTHHFAVIDQASNVLLGIFQVSHSGKYYANIPPYFTQPWHQTPRRGKTEKQPLRPDFCTKHKIECKRDGKERQTLPSIITPVLIPNQGGHITVFKLGAIRKNLSLKRSWWQLLSRPGAQRVGPPEAPGDRVAPEPLGIPGRWRDTSNKCLHTQSRHSQEKHTLVRAA